MTEGYFARVQVLSSALRSASAVHGHDRPLLCLAEADSTAHSCRPRTRAIVLGAVLMPDASGPRPHRAVSRHAIDYFMNHPAAKSIVVMDGFSLLDGQIKSNAGTFFVGLQGFRGALRRRQRAKPRARPP